MESSAAATLQAAPEPKKPVYSISQIGMYIRCGLQWEFRYIQGLIIPPSAAATQGRAVDAGISLNLAQKVTSGIDIPLEQVRDHTSDIFEKEAVTTVWDGDDRGEVKDQALQIVTLHHKELAPTIQPATVQEKFRLNLEGEFDVQGIIDITEKNDVVVDTKVTSAQKQNSFEVARALQPAMYDFAFKTLRDRPAAGFRYDLLIRPTKTLPARKKPVPGKVEVEDHQWAFETIERAHKGIKAGVALPADEGSWACGYCGYGSSGLCPKFKKRGTS